ncbi:DNA topoisomerase [Clostridiaceae bacterium Marseille-Q4143]|nr:DNA topoisomerase [Clostridiaceae bacterium Marseille-Q4143]
MELVIAEKPSVAQSIAAVLGATQRKDGYLEGNEYLVSWCVGHLVELAQPESYEEAWKKWSYESLPIIPQEWQHEVKSDTKAQYQILKKLMHDDRVDAVVCATDAGREGELIFRLTYNMAGCRKPMKRLWISSMEESAIRDGFHNLRPGSDYDNLYHSALCRQEADWLVGINGTRLFTVLYGGKALKVGRVQTPTLAMLVDRESKIMNFKKEAYYMAHIMGNGLDAVSEHISDKTEAEMIAGACENGQALVTSVVKEEKWVAPPKLYDLTTLQRDANRLFGFTAKQTLEYAQSLYEKKLVTYPRTDSQYLSDDMEGTAKNVIEAIFNSLLFEQNVMFNPDIKRILNSKKVTDHHAIIPTMEIIKQDLKAIPESEMKILSLCANRLLCATGEKHIYNSTKAEITCNNIVFKVSGKEVWKNGWKEFEDFFKNSYKTTEDKSDAEEEKKLPELREGMTIAVEQTKVSEHFTQPPKHYTDVIFCERKEWIGIEERSSA